MLNIDLIKRFNYSEPITIESINKVSNFINNTDDITLKDVITIINFNYDLSLGKFNNIEFLFKFIFLMIIDPELDFTTELCSDIRSDINYITPIYNNLKYSLLNYFLANYYKRLQTIIDLVLADFINDLNDYDNSIIYDSDNIDLNPTWPEEIFLTILFYFNINGCLHYDNIFILDKPNNKISYEYDYSIINAINKYRYFTPMRRLWIQLVMHFTNK